jgi:hypothetical protein
MRCEDISAKSIDYLAGTLGEAERRELRNHLDSCPGCRTDLEGLSDTWSTLGELPAMEPNSTAMRARFNALLTASAGSTHKLERPVSDALPRRGNHFTAWLRRYGGLRPALQTCAALLLVFIGIQLGRQTVPSGSADVRELSREVGDLRQMVILSLMQQQSASERLKGVNWSNQIDRPSNDIVVALIDALMHDPNVNVRMASIDALKRFADRDTVRAATLEALNAQASPLVQMALIDFVVETRDRGAIDALRRLSRDRTVDPTVRARATWGIDHLESA